MKVLSIQQPWASLIVLGHKKIETRSWNTKYRGEILIHASAGKNGTNRGIHLDFQQEFSRLQLPKYEDLSFGAIIGKANLVHVLHSDEILLNKVFHYGSSYKWNFTDKELAFGDYSPGRFGWLFSDPVLFEKPIPAKGKLSIWEFDESLLKL
jgi:hypothetical protein